MVYRARKLVGIKLSGWNVNATRFIDPPTWTWEPVSTAAYYELRLAGAHDSKAKTYRLEQPCFEMSAVWEKLPLGKVDLLIMGFDAQGKEICHSVYKHFVKAADFDGQRQEPLDWASALRRHMAYQLAPPRDHIEEFERGLPRGIWRCMEDSVTGQRLSATGSPGMHYPAWIKGMLWFAEQYAADSMADEARAQARAFGQWLLANRLPEDWACSLLPFSTVTGGDLEESEFGNTLSYSGRVGVAMLDLYRVFGQEEYLQYARHLADVLIRFQREDGSWPFRVDPCDGSVKPENEYTSNAVEPATLLASLEEIAPLESYRCARLKATQWLLDNPVHTRRWEQLYFDAVAAPPFANLENWDTCQMIRYLVHYSGQSPAFVEIAEDLNRFVEDQFVLWRAEDYPPPSPSYGDIGGQGPGLVGSAVNLRTPTPMAMEQYWTYHPMAAHTGNWVLALIALHQATQNEQYLVKAICAANAIVRGQQESGAFATWGFDTRFGRPLNTFNWPGDNMCGAIGLMHLQRYCQSLKAGQAWKIGLRGI